MMVRVAFFAEILIEDFDGASRTMYHLINRIDPERFDFLFICGTGPGSINNFECMKVPCLHVPANKRYTVALPSLSKKQIKERLDAFRPQVIHIATPSLLGHFGLNYARDNGIPVISIYHTHFISYIAYYLKHLPFLIEMVKKNAVSVQNRFYNNCDLVYVPSVSIAGELRSSGVEGDRISIWKRGIDTGLFTPLKRDLAFIRKLTGNSRPNILFASRLVWEKNLSVLIAVYSLIQERALPYNLIVAGDGEAAAACRQKMPNAIFTGNLDHETLSVLYASSSVFLFPSITETFGNVVLEAMASGLPCVVADGGGSGDFVSNGVNGFKCRPDNASDFFEKIRSILEDTELHKELSMNGPAFCNGYDWNTLANTYFEDISRLALMQTDKMAC